MRRRGRPRFLRKTRRNIEEYPFAYDKKDTELIEENLPVKPDIETQEKFLRWVRKVDKGTRREEPGWSETQTKTIGKEEYSWEWTPGKPGFRTIVVAEKLLAMAEEILKYGRIFAPVEEQLRETFQKQLRNVIRSWKRKHKSLLPDGKTYKEERIGYCRENELGEIEECFIAEFDGHNWIVKHYPSNDIYGYYKNKMEALEGIREAIEEYSERIVEELYG